MAHVGARYRYRGKFVSPVKAQRIANLRNAKKYLTTQFIDAKGRGITRRGYTAPIEKLVKRAFRKDREKAEEKRRKLFPPKTAKEAERERRERLGREFDFREIIERAAAEAEAKDISVEEALEEVEYEPDEYPDYSYGDAVESAESFMEMGEGYFDFDLLDLEVETDEERYERA